MIIKKHYLLAVVLGALGCGAAQAQADKPSAQTIIQAMVDRYRSASSYQDSGLVRLIPVKPAIANDLEGSSFQPASLDSDVLVSFKTFFVRSKGFRFDWKSSFSIGQRESSIWSEGKKVYRWMPNRGVSHDGFSLSSSSNLQLTIDEAMGSSAGAVFPIMSMLIKDSSVVSFADLLDMATDVALLRDESLEQRMCYVVRVNLSGSPSSLWIDKQSYLLRKTRTFYSRGSFHERAHKGIHNRFLAEQIFREIQIDQPVSRSIFKYRPRLQTHDVDYTR